MGLASAGPTAPCPNTALLCNRACPQVTTIGAVPGITCPIDDGLLSATGALRVFRWLAPAAAAGRTLVVSACGADILEGDPQLTVLRLATSAGVCTARGVDGGPLEAP